MIELSPEGQRKEAAGYIREAFDQLNRAIMRAAKLGVEIERLEEIDTTKLEDRCRCIIYDPIIIMKEKL
jgi:hypothetical protein